MGLKCNIFIKAEYTTMSDDQSGRRIFRGRRESLGGRSGRGRGGRGGRVDRVDRPDSPDSRDGPSEPKFPEIPIRSVPGALLDFILKLNSMMACFNIIFGFCKNGHLIASQAETAARAQIWAALEQIDRHSKFFRQSELSFLLAKLFKQLGCLGKTHRLTVNSLLSFVAQSTPSAPCITVFFENFLSALMDLDPQRRMFWIVVWMCVMTMTDIPFRPEWQQDFFRWFDAKIASSDCPDINEELDEVLSDIHRRTVEFFEAIPESRAPTPAEVAAACSSLQIQEPECDEDGDADVDRESVVSSASSVGGGKFHDSRARYMRGCASIAQLMTFRIQGHALFTALMIPDLKRLIAGLMRRITRRTKGIMSLQNFNLRLSYKLLLILNTHRREYRMKLTEIALRICQATGNIALALAWFEYADKIDAKSVEAVNRAIEAALVLMRLGNLAIIGGEPHTITAVADDILQEAFFHRQMEEPTTLVQKTIEQVEVEVKAAREGKWKQPGQETVRRRPAAAGGGGKEASSGAARHRPVAAGGGGKEASSEHARRRPAAAGGGVASSSGAPSVEEELAMLKAELARLRQNNH
jgi:hypothetical protein